MNKTNKFILIIALILFGLAAVLFLVLGIRSKSGIDNKAGNFSSGNFSKNDKAESENIGKILVQTDDDFQWVDISNGQNSPVSAIGKGDFSGFEGLSKPDQGKKEITDDSLIFFSLDKSKAVLRRAIIIDGANTELAKKDKTAEVSSSDYICQVENKKCEKTNLLSYSYQGISPGGEKNASILWTAWDSQKNILYGHLSDDDGDASPIYVCDTLKKNCQKTQGYDSLTQGEIRANVPEGSFSPTLEKFVMINQKDIPGEQTGIKWELLLYSNADLSKPLKSFDISAAINQDESASYDSVYSLAWSKDEKKIALATESRIYLFDLESDALTLLYMAPKSEDDSIYLDSSALVFSADDKYVLFVENFDKSDLADKDDSGENIIGKLKKIDLTNKNKISSVFESPNLQLEIQ